MATRAQQLLAQQKAAAAKAAAAKAAADKAAAAKAAKAQEAVSAKQMATDARGIIKAAKAQAAAAAAKPPVAPAKPSPEATISDKIKGAVQQYGDAKPLPPSLNPKIQIDQGYGNGIGYDGKPLYPDIFSGIGGIAGPKANATGPMTPTLGGGMAPASVATMMKKGGKVKSKSSYSSGGGVKSTASKRGDGIAQRGKTKGRMV